MSKTREGVQQTEDEAHEAVLERQLDEALAMTFPASDPVAVGAARRRQDRATRPNDAAPAPEPRRTRG